MSEKDMGNVSDGYHTFNELYEHRTLLFCAFLVLYPGQVWKSRLHSDGAGLPGWFIAGAELNGKMITYHLPDKLWDLCGVQALERAPIWDGHTSQDVINRLEDWIKEQVK